MDIMKLLVEFHIDAERQCPGSEETTLQALHALPNYQSFEKAPDIGCGTGAGAFVLTRNLPGAKITALDLLPEFLAELNARAVKEGLDTHMKTVGDSMYSLPFSDTEFDLY